MTSILVESTLYNVAMENGVRGSTLGLRGSHVTYDSLTVTDTAEVLHSRSLSPRRIEYYVHYSGCKFHDHRQKSLLYMTMAGFPRLLCKLLILEN